MHSELLGLLIAFKISRDLPSLVRNNVLERFIGEAIENNLCQFGGGGSGRIWSGVVEPFDMKVPLTFATRQAVEYWLSNEVLILDHYVSELFDLNDNTKVDEHMTRMDQFIASVKEEGLERYRDIDNTNKHRER